MDRTQAGRVAIRGRVYTLWVGPTADDEQATIDWEEREITLSTKGDYLTRVSSCIHEALHAAQRDLSEEAVLEIEQAVMQCLVAYGFVTDRGKE